jgi:hypothetical protein
VFIHSRSIKEGVKNKMSKLICDICGSEKEIPSCCLESMMVKDDYLLCCCSTECDHKAIPSCCGKSMKYVDNP